MAFAVPLSPHDTDDVPFLDMLNIPIAGLLSARHGEIRKNIINCQACFSCQLTKPLSLHNEEARIMIIGERPDDVMLDTEMGMALSTLLQSSQLSLKDVYLTSVTKCIEAMDPTRCQHHLVAELLTVRPLLAIALGYNASLALTPQPAVGSYIPLFAKITLLPTYSMRDVEADNTGQVKQYLLGQFSYIAQQIREMKTA
ncbi:hypothetical protein GZH47_33170 (plasmid) [Paenibacillus rhizovicinus]|uniref:Uracil-DNA glycosylase-like domain-containing protein n=1 Tax=Paenibacillus rhizovicinus TaxID=2704463 RepID=A0A6C0PBB7_9BACL|nr:uracil-DNA glycosylase family protein [Paenibacillus rhizovicinus]QHW35746.1 hypothetical protein GZH47_33170 [Paenibacillus rhizovicinus]